MKKSIFIALLVSGILFAGNSHAQSKTGYINVDDLVAIMPETGKIDSLLERYQVDSLSPMYAKLMTEYQSKLAVYNDSLKTTAAVHQTAGQDLSSLMYQLQNWDQIQNQAIESKRNALLSPIYRKAYSVIKVVAAEKGYSHVLNKQAYLVAPDGEDMIIAVAAKLKIVVPKNVPVGSIKF
jgi:outer membrane protein